MTYFILSSEASWGFVIPILQRKLREVKVIAQGHTANKEEEEDTELASALPLARGWGSYADPLGSHCNFMEQTPDSE